MITQNDKNYSTLTHLSGFAGWVFPLGNIIAPLVLWIAKKNESTYIDSHGKAAVNFQLSIMLYCFLLAILIIPITILTLGLGLIAVLLGIIPAIILKIVLIISASIKATNGEYYNYPYTIEFVK
ncbi:DUF4870 domain-containing protein [Lutibacter maritimus]|jgi:hypothetical protein|uniref:DUF4870 domain-containing protein n=1 Tax=Lutibacter maritimus TaxID=593133 RepID=A0A1I6STJ5_9FLAO|nr:DUF4870 domain-containing protein [Lutibacter maritimus]SFS80223.1 hypothetical protein SAMN04488006_0108 [Lutibacter maritimus]